MVERSVRDREVAGSTPVTPTMKYLLLCLVCCASSQHAVRKENDALRQQILLLQRQIDEDHARLVILENRIFLLEERRVERVEVPPDLPVVVKEPGDQ